MVTVKVFGGPNPLRFFEVKIEEIELFDYTPLQLYSAFMDGCLVKQNARAS